MEYIVFVYISQLIKYSRTCRSYNDLTVAANKEAAEPRVASGKVEVITFRSPP